MGVRTDIPILVRPPLDSFSGTRDGTEVLPTSGEVDVTTVPPQTPPTVLHVPVILLISGCHHCVVNCGVLPTPCPSVGAGSVER